MGTLCSPFHYDMVISLNSQKDQYAVFTEYKNKTPGKKLLAVTYNHRTFNLHEKNYIKALIDQLNFDHLMFSLKPSASLLINETKEIDLDEFREISQVIFVLQTMARYEIKKGLFPINILILKMNPPVMRW